MNKYKLLSYSVFGAYFILTLACLIINYIAINKFIIIVYPEDLQISSRDATQILAERIHERIKDTEAFAFYRMLVILMSVLFILSIFNVGLVCYKEYLKYKVEDVSITPEPEPVPIVSVNISSETNLKNMMQLYKSPH
jgi:hypothetical protein